MISLVFNLYSNDFELGYHADEYKKVKSILTNTQEFKHPLLMLQVVRLANRVFDVDSRTDIVILGRTTTAIFGSLIVSLIYKISKRRLSEAYALGAALLTAVSPGLVIHSHYFKEDIVMTFGIFLSIHFFFEFCDNLPGTEESGKQTPSNEFRKKYWQLIALWGVSIGLACSAKYTALMIVPVYMIIPLLIPHLKRRVYFSGLKIALLAAGLIFFSGEFSDVPESGKLCRRYKV